MPFQTPRIVPCSEAALVVEFGDSNEHSQSHTPLLQIGDYGNPIDELYPMPPSVFP